MSNLRSNNHQIGQNKKAVILQNSFNIIFKQKVHFKGSNNNYYYFQTISWFNSIELLGYQRFFLCGQTKILKKNYFQGTIIKVLSKNNEFFINHGSEKIVLWKFDNLQNCKIYKTLYLFSYMDPYYLGLFNFTVDQERIREIAINQNEDILVFQKCFLILFYNRDENGEWNHQQQFSTFKYSFMNQIRFNESNNKIVAQQTNENEKSVLTVFHKNNQGIWFVTNHIEQSSKQEYVLDQFLFREDLFCFIDAQQFVYFDKDRNIKLIYEIQSKDYKVQIKQLETMEFKTNQSTSSQLIEIKSKNLITLNHQYFFHLKQQNLLKSLKRFPIENIMKID